jgi:tRNA-specific 2-thiouridylase
MKNIASKASVVVAMSGGVDSSVAAALLKKDGYDVRGVYLRLFKDVGSKKSEASARAAAKILDIDFHAVDVGKDFKKKVIRYFLDEYRKGNTPNPCVVCNPELKFKLLLEMADRLKTDYLATGHYALTRKLKVKSSKLKVKEKIIYKLFEAKDKNKDQSYFLYRLAQKQLSKIIFPLGGYLKSDVKELAKKFKLPAWKRKESQDVCFLVGTTIEKFLLKNIKLESGSIIDEAGKVIGRHKGLPLYTLGQRKGIDIGGTGPYYVMGKNNRKNQLIVTNVPKNPALFSDTARMENVNWIAEPPKYRKVLARTRYRNPLVYATIIPRNVERGTRNVYELKFDEPQRAVTPGQSVVFYGKSGEVLGGGIIIS